MSVDGGIMMCTHNYLPLDVCGWRIQINDADCHITIDGRLLNVVDAPYQLKLSVGCQWMVDSQYYQKNELQYITYLLKQIVYVKQKIYCVLSTLHMYCGTFVYHKITNTKELQYLMYVFRTLHMYCSTCVIY